MPNGITIAAGEEERSNEGYRTRASNRAPLVITRRWFRPSYLAFLIFASLLDGLIVVLYLEPEPYGVGGLMSLVIAVVGIVTTYVALALVGNRTVIRVDARNIEVHHGPLPWKRPVVVDVARLRQVYVRYVWRRDGHASHTWNVEATNGTLVPIVLLGEILEREQAEHIWWALEDHLDLPASSLA